MTASKKTTYSPANRIHLLLDTMAGAAIYSTGSTLTIHPLVDILKLFAQRPLIFSFFDYQQKLVYCSTAIENLDPSDVCELLDADSTILFSPADKLNYYVSINLPDGSPPYSLVTAPPAPREIIGQYTLLFRGIEGDSDLRTTFLQALIMPEEPRKPQHWEHGILAPALTDEEYWRLLRPVRGILDEALEQMHGVNLLFNAPDGSLRRLPFPNIFFLIQRPSTASGVAVSGKRSASHLLLSNDQISAIQDWCSSAPEKCAAVAACSAECCSVKTSKDIISVLEMPLDDSSGFSADDVFCSGTIQFCTDQEQQQKKTGGISRNRKKARHLKAAECIHRQIGLENPKSLLIPIHIGGVPWVTLYTITPPGAETTAADWRHNYHFYRTISRSIVTILRAGIQKLYLEQVAAELESSDCYYGGELHTELLNQRWQHLAAVYPFDQVEISAEPSECAYLFAIKSCYSNRSYYIQTFANQWFSRQIPYAFPADELRVLCDAALLRADEKIDVVNRKFNDHINHQAHTVKNMLVPVRTNMDLVASYIDNEHALASDHKVRQKLKDSKNSLDILTATLRILLSPTSLAPKELENIKTVQEMIRWFSDRQLSYHPPLRFTNLHEEPVLLHDLPASFTVLWNLLYNAVRHSTEGTDAIQVTLSSDINGNVVLAISNHGDMSHSARDRLCGCMTPGFDEKYKGLPITAKEIIKAGWQIMDVILGAGTTVRINLSKGAI